MSELPQDEFSRLKSSGQKALVEFLSVDLDLAHTYLETAKIDADNDPAHARRLLEDAAKVLITVRSLQGRIEDPAERSRVNDKANRLESELRNFPVSE